MSEKPATIKDILGKLRVPNLAKDIKDDVLGFIAKQVIEDYSADKESMDSWTEFVEKGQRLSVQELHGKAEPWPGSANFKSPVLLNAALKFGDRASATLLRQKDIVKMDVIGKDLEGEKKARAERVATHMNYQLNYSMSGWREDQDSLLYSLGQEGTVFKRSFFDAAKGRNVSEIIRAGTFAVNQSNSHIDDARSFTIIRRFDQNEALEKQREGIWLDIPLNIETKTPTEVVTGDEDDDPNPSEVFYEQDMFYDLDDDGYAEPYIATVHKISSQVVRLIARYNEDGIYVGNEAGLVTTIGRIIDPLDDNSELTFDGMTLVRIEPETMTTKYGFIPAIDGTFLNIGYFHLLAGITQAINSSTNHMINAGHLQTTKTTFVAKGFRKKMGNMILKIGQMNKTDISAEQLQNAIRIMDFGEPSQVLLALTQEMKSQAEQLSGSADVAEAIGANAPATTMLGLIQEQMVPMAALIMRVYRAEKEEFKKLFILNSKFTDPVEYEFLLDEEEIEFREDYDVRMMDVMPAANPEMTSKVQKLIQLQIQLEQFDRVLQAGGNPIPILMEFFEVVGADRIDEIFPPAEEGEEDEQLKMLREQQAIQGKIAQGQLKVLEDQVEVAQARAMTDQQKADDKSRDTTANIEKVKAEIILTREKAESEDATNQIDIYTQGIDRALKLLELEINRENADADRQVNLGSGNQSQQT